MWIRLLTSRLFPLGVREGQSLCTSTTRNRGWAAGTHHCSCQLGHAGCTAESLVRARLSHRCLPSNKRGAHWVCVIPHETVGAYATVATNFVKGEVHLFLQQSKIDILLVSETHFPTKVHFQIPQYNTYYTSHPLWHCARGHSHTTETDKGIPTVQDVIHKRSNKHRAKLQSHPNPLLQSLSRDNIPRRLKRRWPTDL